MTERSEVQPARGDRSVILNDLGAVWANATDALADEIVSPQQRAYLRLTRLRAIVEDTALISVPDAFTRDVIESRLRPAITDALSKQLGRPIQVAVTVRPPEDNPAAAAPAAGDPDLPRSTGTAVRSARRSSARARWAPRRRAAPSGWRRLRPRADVPSPPPGSDGRAAWTGRR